MNAQYHSFSEEEIYVNEILLPDHNSVYLFGFIYHEQRFKETQFVISRHLFDKLLLSNGPVGFEIKSWLTDILRAPHTAPLELSLIDKFGFTLPIKIKEIKLQVPFKEDGSCTPTRHNLTQCLVIEKNSVLSI